jgi:hypothetical protein
MSFALVTFALVVAIICVPTAAGMTAMALAGGDGEPKNWFAGFMGAVVGFGSVYNVLASFAAYWGLDGLRTDGQCWPRPRPACWVS